MDTWYAKGRLGAFRVPSTKNSSTRFENCNHPPCQTLHCDNTTLTASYYFLCDVFELDAWMKKQERENRDQRVESSGYVLALSASTQFGCKGAVIKKHNPTMYSTTVAALCPRFPSRVFRQRDGVIARPYLAYDDDDNHQPVRNRPQMHLQRYFAGRDRAEYVHQELLLSTANQLRARPEQVSVDSTKRPTRSLMNMCVCVGRMCMIVCIVACSE
jgi:hypothetical protein